MKSLVLLGMLSVEPVNVSNWNAHIASNGSWLSILAPASELTALRSELTAGMHPAYNSGSSKCCNTLWLLQDHLPVR